jgi:hypothetical protein
VIFGRVRQGDARVSYQHGGIGLGLALSRAGRIDERHLQCQLARRRGFALHAVAATAARVVD